MSEYLESICPLCSQVFPRQQLYEQMESDTAQLRQNTIAVIQAYHPGWIAEHGACEACWKSYRDAGRVLAVLRTARPRHPGPLWEPTPPVSTATSNYPPQPRLDRGVSGGT